MKTISVVVPVYNVENYLPSCIDSIINQSYKQLEIILVNDGSTDSSGIICEKYATNDKRVIIKHIKNSGSSVARNEGLDIATGEYIAFVDSDDYINTDMFSQMVEALEEYNLDFVEITPNHLLNKNLIDKKLYIEDRVTAINRILKTTAFSVWRRLYRKDLVSEMRFIPGIIHQDVFFTMDVLNKIEKSGFINNTLYYYNKDNYSVIRSKYSKQKLETGIRATEYIVKSLKDYSKTKKAVDNYLTHYYTDHFFLLSRNTSIDPNKKYRKKLKSAIIQSINNSNKSLRPLMVRYLPIWLMNMISSTYYLLKIRNKYQ